MSHEGEQTRRSPLAARSGLLRRGLMASAALVMSAPALAIDWEQVESSEIRLFHPGQSSLEALLDPEFHDERAVQRFQMGRSCTYCHEGEEAEKGERILGDRSIEPEEFDGRAGHLDLEVQAAHDGERLYLRYRWDEGGSAGDPMAPDVQARVTSMFTDGSIQESQNAGCWAACHDDLSGMASDTPDLDLTKYYMHSRTGITRSGGGENFRDDAELAQALEAGMFGEYWGADITGDDSAEGRGGYVLEARHAHDDPDVNATVERDGDSFVAEISRPLAGNETRLALESGNLYHGGFAVHDDHTKGRFHYVSLNYTLSIDSDEGDVAAMEQ